MRLHHADGTTVHLAYCTNVHAGDVLDDVLAHLDRFCLPVRQHLGADLLGVGLWLAAPAALELAHDAGATERLRAALDRRGLEVVTLNAFPYRGFQEPVVKHRVYHPDWSQQARLDYTVDCAAVLARLLPDDAARGSISTLPLAWRTPWEDARAATALDNLARLAESLDGIEDQTGRSIRVGLEPEPGCVIETTADVVRHLDGVDTRRIGVNLDLCHLAVQFEDAAAAVARVTTAGLPIVKSQVSAALHADDADDPATRTALATFDEERFLHQTRSCGAGGLVESRDDLGEALAGDRPLSARTSDGAAGCRGACTSTSRSTPSRRCHSARPTTTPVPPSRPSSAVRPRSSTTSRSRPTPGASCPSQPAHAATTTLPVASRASSRGRGTSSRHLGLKEAP